jgi:signal peptidase I
LVDANVTQRTWKRRTVILVLAVLALVGAPFFLGLLTTYKVPSESMAPALVVGDRFLARQVSGEDLVGGEVITFFLARERGGCAGGAAYVARVVAVAGDSVEARAATLSVNGQVIDEPHVAGAAVPSSFAPLVVPEGHVFVMGDNRSNAMPFEPVPHACVRHRAIGIITPLSRFGSL